MNAWDRSKQDPPENAENNQEWLKGFRAGVFLLQYINESIRKNDAKTAAALKLIYDGLQHKHPIEKYIAYGRRMITDIARTYIHRNVAKEAERVANEKS